MSLKTFSSEQLVSLEQSILRGEARGVKFALADVRSEMRRRLRYRFDPREVASAILEQTKSSADGLTTYGALWKALTGGKAWTGNASQSAMGRELGHLIAYCYQNRLPFLSVLVVTQRERALSDAAIAGICNDFEALGIVVGPDRRAFVEAHAREAREIAVTSLPSN